jgi:hypothetical protein
MIQSIPLWLGIALGTLGISTIVLIIVSIRMHKRLKSFMKGKDGASLEAVLAWLTQKNAQVDETLLAHKQALEMIDSRVKKSVRGYSLVRYDAYDDTGGNQSFASGIIDEQGDGFILSVITNRNHVGVYAKPVNRGISAASLTPEETLALENSKKSLNI